MPIRACREGRFAGVVPNPTFKVDTHDVRRRSRKLRMSTGFDVKIQSTEFATSLDIRQGPVRRHVLAWSGRADPMATFSFDSAAVLNMVLQDTTILNKSRRRSCGNTRMTNWLDAWRDGRRTVHRHWLWATARTSGFRPIRRPAVQGLKLN
jgi:hypothetical protein